MQEVLRNIGTSGKTHSSASLCYRETHVLLGSEASGELGGPREGDEGKAWNMGPNI